MVKRKREAKTKIEADLLKLLLFVDTFWVSELSLILCWKQEIWVLSLGQEDPLEEEVATHCSNSVDRGTWWATVHGVAEGRT